MKEKSYQKRSEGLLVLLSIFSSAAAFYIALTSLRGGLSSCVYAFILILFYMVGGLLFLCRQRALSTPGLMLGAAVTLCFGLCIRMSLLDHISGDYVSFLSIWTETMRGMTIRQALSTPIGDYNMPYLYLILLCSRLPFYDLYCIKLFSILADLFSAFGIMYLVGLFTGSEKKRFAGFALALLLPTTWLNSAYWGQCDSVYGALAIWGLYCALSKKSRRAMVLLALSFSFKLQALFLLPICIFLYASGRIRLRDIPFFPAAFLAVMLPALLGGRSFYDTFSIYFSQATAYPYLSLNAPSFWSIISNDYFDELSGAPVLICGGALMLVFILFLSGSRKIRKREMLAMSLLFCLMIPWLLPRMHERYFYLAEMLSIAYALVYNRRHAVLVILMGGGFLIYSAYLFGEVPILSLRLIAAIYGLLLLYIAFALWRDTAYAPPAAGCAEKGKNERKAQTDIKIVPTETVDEPIAPAVPAQTGE